MREKILSKWSFKAEGKPITVWPDGCCDLIFSLSTEGKGRFFCTALDSHAYWIHVPKGTLFYGVRLMPGLRVKDGPGLPFESLRFLGQKELSFESSECFREFYKNPDKGMSLLEETVEGCFNCSPPWIIDFLQALDAMEGKVSASNGSLRTLRRHMNSFTGASPKFWLSLFRVRRCARKLVFSEKPLAEVAYDCNFSDQAHMTRETKRWFGLSPSKIRKEREAYASLASLKDAFSISI